MNAPAFTQWLVMVCDQKRSRNDADRVPEALDALSAKSLHLRLPFERTAGDEIQGLTQDAATAVEAIRTLSRLGGWRIGLGLGTVEVPIPDSTRAARGSAYVLARSAITQARTAPGDLRLLDEAGFRAAVAEVKPPNRAIAFKAAETTLMLLRSLWARRTAQGWAVIDLLESGMSAKQASKSLGVSPSAVSQRMARAGYAEEARGLELAKDLIQMSFARQEPV